MALSTNDNAQLLIRCPSCGQRFRVGEDLRDRTVECGACEHRFRINDEVIMRSKKFYPGERTDALANRYHRVPITAPVPEGLQTAQYADVADASAFEPVSPQRLIAGAMGAIAVVLMALLLYFGAKNGGALDGMPTVNRMAMAAFTAAVAAALFIYANPKTRRKAIIASVLCAGLLLSLPLFRTEGTEMLVWVGGGGDAPVKTRPPKRDDKTDPIEQLRNLIGTDPLVKEAALAAKGSGKRVCGLWLRGLGDGDKLLVRDYLVRTVAADPTTHAYPRGPGEYLMVVTGLDKTLDVVTGLDITLDTLAKAIEPLSETGKMVIHREIDVIEVPVKAEYFQTIPIEKLADRGGPAFYELNRRELESIDLVRVKGAVERLAGAEPNVYRSDITRRLVGLLNEEGVDFKAQVCDALVRWGDDSERVGKAAETLLAKLDAAKATIPTELIALLVKEKRESIIPVLERLWLEDVSKWERYLVAMGPQIEATMIARFPELTPNFRFSAVNVLGKVGGRDSLELLKTTAREGAKPDLLVRIEAAEKAIRVRLGE
jgi:predicted Zn finger-like uncharacterized protein